MRLTFGATATSGWLPASILAIAATVVLAAYGTPVAQIAIFAAYVTLGIALPGMLWVRLLRGRATHISEDLTLGLALGYCIEIATYIPTRAIGVPLLFLLWPILTLAAFAAIPGLRRYWRGNGERAPTWWSWSLAAMVGYLLIYSAGTFFAQHHLSGTHIPYVDMPYHLALIGELRHHVPPDIPYVTGVPLAYHWFFYAEAAATTWATGIEPITLLYRLSGLPMFVTFVLLTAASARRLVGGWWSGPVAVAIALLGTVAGPYGWIGTPVYAAQTLGVTWISPTNLFGIALFSAVILTFIDLLGSDTDAPHRRWLLIGLLIFGVAGAKASLLPLLIVGLMAVVTGVAISRHRLHRDAAAGLGLAAIGLVLATILLFRGTTGAVTIGLESLRSLPVVRLPGARAAHGLSRVVMPVAGWVIALLLWSFSWAGVYGLLVRPRKAIADPRILLLLGICAGALGAVTVLNYVGLSQLYYLKGAVGALGLLTTAGVAAVLPVRARYVPLVAGVVVAASAGAAAVLAISAMGPTKVPTLPEARLSGVLVAIILPVLALVGVALIAYAVLRLAAPKRPVLHGAIPLLVIALVMGFSLPNVARLVASPFDVRQVSGASVPGDGADVARWLRDHSVPVDLVATNLHCRPLADTSGACDARHFWISGYSERHVFVEGWSYTTKATTLSKQLGVSYIVVPFWDQPLLARNDLAFTDPSPAALAELHDRDGVRWLFADLTKADAAALGREADLRYRQGDFAVYELR